MPESASFATVTMRQQRRFVPGNTVFLPEKHMVMRYAFCQRFERSGSRLAEK
jgi:hypothetical protein